MSDRSTLWSIENTAKSTLTTTKHIQGEIAALTAATAAIHQETRQLSASNEKISRRLDSVEEKTAQIQQMVYELFEQSRRQHLMQMAQTQIVKVRQEREKLYGNYDKVRKTTEGILLATDVGIVRQNTIVTSAEELRLSTPRYWLSSCLVALSAWINNDKETGDRAIKEALKLDDEKTSLFFALVCRRASRGNACNQWMVRYLRGQDPENLDMRCVFVLDAYANGLFGSSENNSVFTYMNEWVDILSQKGDFEQRQIDNWRRVVLSVMVMPDVSFRTIEEYCTNIAVFKSKLLVSHLHGNLFNYLDNIMSVTVDTSLLRDKLDEILKELITLFDDDERVKVYEEKEMEYIIQFQGDEARARNAIQLDRSKFEDTKDFTMILSEAAMGTQDMFNSPSTRKLSVAFCKEWIRNAYNDILAKERMTCAAPMKFMLNYWFEFETYDGRDQGSIVSALSVEIGKKIERDIERITKQTEEQKNQSKLIAIGTGVAAAVFLIITIASLSVIPGVLAVVLAVISAASYHYFKVGLDKEMASIISNIEAQYLKEEKSMTEDIKRICAEAVKMSQLVNEKNKDEAVTRRLLDELSPELYIRKYEDDKARHVRV